MVIVDVLKLILSIGLAYLAGRLVQKSSCLPYWAGSLPA